jgi:hypothetical protein
MSTHLDTENPIIQLCILGTQAEFAGRMDDARELYLQAWQSASDDYEACIAAHYVARFGENPAEILHWNQVALNHADAVGDERVKDFYPSLYLNLGHSYELLGDSLAAEKYYALAAALGAIHQAE